MSLDDDAYLTVLDFIRRNGLKEGHRIPPERDLAQKFGMSRNRLRAALARLEADGALNRHVGRGTFVGNGKQRREEATARAATFTSPREVMEARLAIEPSLARLAAYRATAHDVERMDICLARGNSPDDVPTFRRWDMKLHQALTHASGNSLLDGIFRYIHADRSHLWRRLGHLDLSAERIRSYVKQHRAIVEAIRERDPDAAESGMRQHLETVRANLFREF